MFQLFSVICCLLPIGLLGQITLECALIGSGGGISQTGSYQHVSALGESILGIAGNGTDSTEIGFVFKSEAALATSIHPLFSLPQIELYPNPTRGLIHLESNSSRVTHYKMWDVQGRLIRSAEIQEQEIDISDLKQGSYYLQVFDRKQRLLASFHIIKSNN
ncbi:MAG: T9SS type A sorting domain-containing protein [Bacteroidota bacterium]